MKKPLILLILSMGVQACGQTGHLYHPDERVPIYVPKEKSDK